MKPNKELVLEILKTIHFEGQTSDIVSDNSVLNVVVFNNEILIDININNPSLQAKNNIKSKILKSIKSKFNQKIDIKINFKLKAETNKTILNLNRKLDNISNILAISSGKGGVGKSTVTANLAISLSQMGFSVGILDADIYGPSIPLMFDIFDSKPLAVNVNGKSKMKPIESFGVKILSIGFFTKLDQAVIWRGPMASKALNQMIFDADWGDLDFLLIDLPPGTGDIHLSIMQSLPISGAVIVSTPQNVALVDARKGISMFNQENINVPVLGIIENMSYFSPLELPDNKYYLFGKEGAKNLSIDLEVPFLGEIPLIQSIRESGDYGRPAALQDETLIQSVFNNISKNMLSELIIRNKKLPETEVIKITTMSGCSAIK
ncbi:MAG: Mrp/NBP35 family ATP-binding protein [Flavobacteriaceae bacterium]|nr:Mrp/NBP35 family ATP-binding protein [Flavobacteriaceae bacterium]MBT3794446.1 Mrp/NBP35 family ATP-binding protein [Flavobacteriaceae bacterium]MBT4063414.1 Mrp/NBP35 family ATP-binding protein [Flavobacteriaceae bacterium]MBT4246233.1 Mrp/NBP35 family ATP-binding protein [Flavobacteriaceae bacterium]MBT4415832.1 Mrp/NBP35 family ATP-binding protein [Flavobacteriaceae bacterium]